MTKTLFVLFLSISLNTQAAFWSQTQSTMQAQNVCTQCSMDAQRLLSIAQGYGVLSSPTDETKSLVVINSGADSIEYTENIALERLKNRIELFSTQGRSLIAKADANKNISFQLYYQLALNKFGETSVFDRRNKPTYETERHSPHELWGFYQNTNNNGHVLINEYQNFWNADYTLIHELFHLLDNKSKTYIEIHNDEWTILDDLAIEFRALLAEAIYRLDVRNSPQFRNEPLISKDFRDQFINRNKLNTKAIVEYTTDLFYPIKLKQDMSYDRLTFDQDSKIFSFSYNPRLLNEWSSQVPEKILNSGILETVGWFFEQTLQLKLNQTFPGSISAMKLSYKKIAAQDIIRQSRKNRDLIAAILKQRGFNSFYDYLLSEGLFSEETQFELRQDQLLNKLPGKSGSPAPRVIGGGI
jgi:hypothetical protein